MRIYVLHDFQELRGRRGIQLISLTQNKHEDSIVNVARRPWDP